MELKPMNPADILKMYSNPEAKIPTRTVAEIEAEIAALEIEAAKALAVETFLDCNYELVKVSKVPARIPKYAKQYVRGRATKTVGDSFMCGRQKHYARFGS